VHLFLIKFDLRKKNNDTFMRNTVSANSYIFAILLYFVVLGGRGGSRCWDTFCLKNV